MTQIVRDIDFDEGYEIGRESKFFRNLVGARLGQVAKVSNIEKQTLYDYEEGNVKPEQLREIREKHRNALIKIAESKGINYYELENQYCEPYYELKI